MTIRLTTITQAVQWLQGRVLGQLCTDSREIGFGDGFIAWPGAATDGRKFVPGAIGRGAAACLVEENEVEPFSFDSEKIATFENLKPATGLIAAEYCGNPSHRMDLIAVTGTNGKTSTAWWLAQALSNLEAGKRRECAVVGTLGIGVPPQVQYNGLTTPDPVLMQQQLQQLLNRGVKACVIEASSIGIAEHRLDGTRLRVAMFTNFTQDHLDYHASMQAYWEAKSRLFDWPDLEAAVINLDDERSAELVEKCQQRGLSVWTISTKDHARLQAENITFGKNGMRFTVAEGIERHSIDTNLIGAYNVSNLLGVIATMRFLNVSLKDAASACATLQPVPGRMECINVEGQPMVVVDFAHTPDAIEKALQALRPITHARGGKLYCVFGCGGDRDSGKRPIMAAAVERHADRVVITSDNPRSEKPEVIIAQMMLGLSTHEPYVERVRVEVDRARAIASTLAQATKADVVLIAGKGHEDYQEVHGVKHHFSDQEQAKLALDNRTKGSAA